MSLHVVSLFAGIGGIDIAFERAGARTVLFCEADKHARMVLARHWPDTPIHPDVRELTADDLRNAGARPDNTVVCAGFPCQDLSIAGSRRGMGKGTRSGLFWQIVRLLADFPARWVVLENVPGLLSSHGDWTAGQSDSQRYKQLGNGVAVPVFEWVAARLIAQHEQIAGAA